MSFRIGKVNIKASFLFFAAAAYFLSADMWENYLCAVLFSSFHEAGHLIAFLRFGCPPEGVTLGIMGAVIEKKPSALSYKQECAAALCGPFVNFIFLMIFFILKRYEQFFELPFIINAGLFAVNMLPVKALDGGRFLYFFLLRKTDMRRAEKIMNTAEIVTAASLIAVLIASLIFDFVNTSFVLFSSGLALLVMTGLLFPKKPIGF